MVTSLLLVILPGSPEEPESVGGDDGLLLRSRRDPLVDRVLGSRVASGLPSPMDLFLFVGFTRFLGSFLRAPRGGAPWMAASSGSGDDTRTAMLGVCTRLRERGNNRVLSCLCFKYPFEWS